MHFTFKLFRIVFFTENLENIETENKAIVNAHNQEARRLHISSFLYLFYLIHKSVSCFIPHY